MKIVDCLPDRLKVLSKYLDKLQQVRLVANFPIKVKIDGTNFYLSQNGLQKGTCGAVCVDTDEIAYVIKTACQSSVYAFEKQLANGYFTLDDGTRIGVAGNGVCNQDGEIYFSNYTSLCVRFNRCVDGCSSGVGENLLLNNILVVGLPGYGKTTFLRDLAIRCSKQFDAVVLDERGELSQVAGFTSKASCDVLLHLSRCKSAVVALQSLSPQILVLDEVFDIDATWLKSAIDSGVKVYATMHADSFLSAKAFCDKNLLNFDFYVILEQFGGKMAKLYDKSAKYITL